MEWSARQVVDVFPNATTSMQDLDVLCFVCAVPESLCIHLCDMQVKSKTIRLRDSHCSQPLLVRAHKRREAEAWIRIMSKEERELSTSIIF